MTSQKIVMSGISLCLSLVATFGTSLAAQTNPSELLLEDLWRQAKPEHQRTSSSYVEYNQEEIAAASANRRKSIIETVVNDIRDIQRKLQVPDFNTEQYVEGLLGPDFVASAPEFAPGKDDKPPDALDELQDLVGLLTGIATGTFTPVQDCLNQNPPKLDKCKDFDKTIADFTELLSYNACIFAKQNAPLTVDAFIGPLKTLVNTCGNYQNEIVKTKYCTERFDDGEYDGFVQTPISNDNQGLLGETNKYGWGADFSEECGVGIMIHSAGTLALLRGQYSLPTFTLRNATGEIIYEGIYAATDPQTFEIPPQAGFRSARIVECEGSIITVLAPNIGQPGAFYLFDLDLDDYTEGGDPVIGVVNSRPPAYFPASSARSLHQIDDAVFLYAPLYDLGGQTEVPALRLFDWVEFEDMDVELALVGVDGSYVPGFVWDFECMDEGLCWVNTAEVIENDPTIEGDEQTLSRLFYFDIEEVSSLDFNSTLPRQINITLEETPLDFSLNFSSLSLEPITEDGAVACTLSGFIYNIFGKVRGYKKANGLEVIVDGGNTDRGGRRLQKEDEEFVPSRATEALQSVELAQAQQCNICATNKNLTEMDPGIDLFPGFQEEFNNNTGTRNLRGSARELQEFVMGFEETFEGCRPLPFDDMRNSIAYVWQVAECDGKIFAGTLDLSYWFATTIIRAFMNSAANNACTQPAVYDQACAAIGCFGTPEENLAQCAELITLSFQWVLDSDPILKTTLEAYIVTGFYGEDHTPSDFGFDLYEVDKEDLLKGDDKAIFEPVTINGFRELSPAPTAAFDDVEQAFNPESDIQDAVRNMVCHTDPITGSKKLIIGSAVYGQQTSSKTFVVDLDEKACKEKKKQQEKEEKEREKAEAAAAAIAAVNAGQQP